MSRKLTTEEFVQKAKEKHNGKYDYSRVEYKDSKEKVCIICKEDGHGEFYQRPNDHIRGCGCPMCKSIAVGDRRRSSTEKFIRTVSELHNGKYDYSKVKYKNNTTRVCIICPTHGEFYQTPNSHLNGNGCSKCAGNTKLTSDDFRYRATKIHNGKYDYSKVE